MVVLELHLTNKCNLKCLHCYGNFSTENSTFLSSEIAIKALNDFKFLSDILAEPAIIAISGGEPLLHPHFFSLLDYAANEFDEVIILTNGMLVTNQIASVFSEHSHLSVQLSLEGTESVHDSIRGNGNFLKVLAAINTFQNENVEISCSMTVNKLNFHNMEPFLSICKKNYLIPIFHRYIPQGRGRSILKLSPSDNIAFYNKIVELSVTYPIQPHCTCCSLVSITGNVKSFPNECNIGTHCIVVDEQGNYIPCSYIRQILGNVRTFDLVDIFFNSEELKKFRERKFGKFCYKCKYNSVCGGCRAIAQAYSGDIFSDDPLCPIIEKNRLKKWV